MTMVTFWTVSISTRIIILMERSNLRQARRGEALTDVLVLKFMGQAHPLRLMLDRLAVHNGRLELFCDAAVDSVTLETESVQARDPRCEKVVLLSELTKSSTVRLLERSTTGAV